MSLKFESVYICVFCYKIVFKSSIKWENGRGNRRYSRIMLELPNSPIPYRIYPYHNLNANGVQKTTESGYSCCNFNIQNVWL